MPAQLRSAMSAFECAMRRRKSERRRVRSHSSARVGLAHRTPVALSMAERCASPGLRVSALAHACGSIAAFPDELTARSRTQTASWSDPVESSRARRTKAIAPVIFCATAN
jgi:hypothetical protein